MRFGHGVAHLHARRVDDANHAGPYELVLDHICLLRDVGDVSRGIRTNARHLAQRSGLERSVGLAERAVGFTRELLHFLENVLAIAFGELAHRAIDEDAVAVAQQHVRGSLGEHGELARVGVVLRDDRHALALRRERDLGHAGEVVESLVGVRLACRHDERNFGRVADDLPGSRLGALAQFAVVGQRAGAKRGVDLLRDVLRHGIAVQRHHIAFRRIAGAGEFNFAARHDHAFHRHLVAGERTGLVGADDGGGAQRLHRMQLLHDGMVCGHALHTESQHDGEDGRQAFRHGGDGKRNGEQQRVDDVMHAMEAFEHRERHQHHHGNDAHGDAENLRDVVHFLLQRRGVVFGGLQQVGDLAHLRVHAGAGHDGTAGALRHGRAVEHHVRAVAQCLGLLKRFRLLAHRHRFAGE